MQARAFGHIYIIIFIIYHAAHQFYCADAAGARQFPAFRRAQATKIDMRHYFHYIYFWLLMFYLTRCRQRHAQSFPLLPHTRRQYLRGYTCSLDKMIYFTIIWWHLHFPFIVRHTVAMNLLLMHYSYLLTLEMMARFKIWRLPHRLPLPRHLSYSLLKH